jgi:dTDP-4-dehydrorhamnose 3,5-epimerase|tara:strand:- start:197 stop:658 length:462 start_codon:yes stop_codon:yes gene_type:complete
MSNDEIKLETHQTKDIHDQHVNGSLTVIWRDWDNIISNPPKMVYVSSVNPGEIKGPHIHKKRHSYFTCVHGTVVFIIQDKTGSYKEIESNSENPVMVHVPPGISSAHINISDGISRVLTLADLAWKPDDDEMDNVVFENYDWKKWSKNSNKNI